MSPKLTVVVYVSRGAASRTIGLNRTGEFAQGFFEILTTLRMRTTKSNGIKFKTRGHDNLQFYMILKWACRSVKV